MSAKASSPLTAKFPHLKHFESVVQKVYEQGAPVPLESVLQNISRMVMDYGNGRDDTPPWYGLWLLLCDGVLFYDIENETVSMMPDRPQEYRDKCERAVLQVIHEFGPDAPLPTLVAHSKEMLKAVLYESLQLLRAREYIVTGTYGDTGVRLYSLTRKGGCSRRGQSTEDYWREISKK